MRRCGAGKEKVEKQTKTFYKSGMERTERAAREEAEITLLTGAKAGEMLRFAYSGEGLVRSWSVYRVHHRPGAGVSVGYRVIIDEKQPFKRSDLYILASTARIGDEQLSAAAGKRLRLGETKVNLWKYPFDPELPALPVACDTGKMSRYLGYAVDLELLGYRPTRRAVVKAAAVGTPHNSPLYLKVLRPRAGKELEERLNAVRRAGIPGPQIHSSVRGMVVTESVRGVPLSKLFAATCMQVSGVRKLSRAEFALTRRSLADTLDALPELILGKKRLPAWAERCDYYADAAAAALPGHAGECRQAAEDIRYLLSRADMGRPMPVHGDFYEANVYVDPQTGLVSGILDLDSLSVGYRVHDWGCLLGHMSVLPGISADAYAFVPQLTDDWFAEIRRETDPCALCASAAGVVLSLVSGSRRKSVPRNRQALNRLRTAQKWIARGYGML